MIHMKSTTLAVFKYTLLLVMDTILYRFPIAATLYLMPDTAHFPLLPLSGNHYSTFCFFEFEYFGFHI